MYNAEWKNEYLQYTNNSSNAVNMFNYVEKFENEAGHDLYDMTANEVIQVISSCNTAWFAERIKTEINRYFEYCRARNRIAVNVVKAVRPEDWKKIIEERKQVYYLSSEKYKKYLDKILESDGGYYDAAIFASVYNNIAGVKFFNLVHLRLRNIDVDTNRVHLEDGRDKAISRELIEMLMKASSISELQGDKYLVNLPYSLYPDSIWRVSKEPTDTTVARRLISRLERIRKLLQEPDLTYNSICNSGIFNRIVEKTRAEKLNIKADLDSLYRQETVERYLPIFNTEDIANIKQFKDRCGNYVKHI